MLSCFSDIWLWETLWSAACQAPLCMGFSKEEYWSGLPCPAPGTLSHPGIESASLMSNLHWQVDSLLLAPPGKPCLKSPSLWYFIIAVRENLPAKQETGVQSLAWKDPLKNGMATPVFLPWTEKLGGLQSMGSPRVRKDWATNTLTLHFQQTKAATENRVVWRVEEWERLGLTDYIGG